MVLDVVSKRQSRVANLTEVLKMSTLKCFTTDLNIYRRDGKVTWLDLQDGLRKVVESARSDVSYKEREMPEWLVANRKVPSVPSFVRD